MEAMLEDRSQIQFTEKLIEKMAEIIKFYIRFSVIFI